MRWACLLPALLLPVTAAAAIYKWSDESGRTVYSNRLPANGTLAKAAKIVVEDDSVPAPADAAREETARRERELAQRIADLERQLAIRQYAPPVQYYPASPPPPPVYYGDMYYPHYGAYGYPYFGVPASFVTVRRFAAPRFISRPIGLHGGRVGGRHR